jgi:uncharacterized protein (TIGR00303 family)
MSNKVEFENFVEPVRDPDGRLKAFLHDMRAAVRKKGRYALCIGSTHTSDIEWISAAGADGAARRLTPAIDAEALVLGCPKSSEHVPVSPAGIVSPVVLSRAMLDLVDCDIEVFDCGSFHPPQLECRRVGTNPAACVQTGNALPLDDVRHLFEEGRRAGISITQDASYLIIGECVPAGTTTALGVLTGLGYSAGKLVSSSMPSANHDERGELVRSGLVKAGLLSEHNVRAGLASSAPSLDEPLRAVAAVGDPMQAFAAGLAIEASKNVPVVLGGGTQMLAVYALAAATEGADYLRERPLAVITTKWVAFDTGSNPAALADLVGAPFAASCPNFHTSRHPGLRAYEEGNVKEGVAAGALMALAHLAGRSEKEICEAIDNQYDTMVKL